MNKAVEAIEKGLQTHTAQNLKKMVLNKENMNDGDRGEFVAFLTDSDEYAPAGGEIVGILKTMGDEMSADIATIKKTEADEVTAYDALMAAKKRKSKHSPRTLRPSSSVLANSVLRLSLQLPRVTPTKCALFCWSPVLGSRQQVQKASDSSTDGKCNDHAEERSHPGSCRLRRGDAQ